MIRFMKIWSWQREDLPSVRHGARTALAATASLLIARLIGMPEAYWSAITTIVVMQSNLGATLTLSIERIVAGALGASLGAIESTYFGQSIVVFGVTIFLLGLISRLFQMEKTGYHYAGVTLGIVTLVPRTNPPWYIATHRFIEVSIGILIALAVAAIWLEEWPLPAKQARNEVD
jgi:uncharacterized membrane protein YccC